MSSNRRRTVALVAALMLVTAVAVPAVAAAETSLSVTVDQDHETGDALVTVTDNDTAVENATVNVTTDENVSYAALNETYKTDEDGTTVLPAPSEDLNVTVTATSGNLSAETDAELTAPELDVSATQNDAGELYVEVTKGTDYVENATVTVESDDGDYAYDDTYTATDGTLTLPAPTENVSVTVTASDGDETATTNTTLSVQTDDNANNDFAEALVTFIEHLKSQDYEGPLGQQVSEFVHANNPASDKANGPPEHAGPNGDDAGDNETDGDDRRGPPEHAGANGDLDQTRDEDHDRDTENETETTDADDVTDDEDEEEEEVEDEEAGDDDDESERGPPAHANNA